MSKLTTIAATAATLPILAISGSAFADGSGQIGGGSEAYTIKNLTQNTAYANPANAKCGDEVEYSIRLHNSGYVAVNNINVVATLPSAAAASNTSVMTATYTDGIAPSTTVNATLNLDSASDTVTYEAGTTKLYDGNGNVLKTEADTITTSGVNVGSINGSTTEYLNFKAKVTCTTTTTTPPPTTTTPPVTTTTTSTPATPAAAAPTQLVNTGAGDVAAIFAAATAAGVVGYRVVLGRRLSRQ